MLVLTQLKPFAGKGFQMSFLFKKREREKKRHLDVPKLSKTSCFDIQRKIVFWLAASLLRNNNFQKQCEKTPQTPPQTQVCFKDLSEPNSKLGLFDLRALKWNLLALGSDKVFGVSIYSKNPLSLLGDVLVDSSDAAGIQVYGGKAQ